MIFPFPLLCKKKSYCCDIFSECLTGQIYIIGIYFMCKQSCYRKYEQASYFFENLQLFDTKTRKNLPFGRTMQCLPQRLNKNQHLLKTFWGKPGVKKKIQNMLILKPLNSRQFTQENWKPRPLSPLHVSALLKVQIVFISKIVYCIFLL